jgi:hypothetical protein
MCAAMKRRYSIWGTEYGSDHEVELAQVDNDPQTLLDAFSAKMLTINHSIHLGGKTARKSKMRKYTWLRIVDNSE